METTANGTSPFHRGYGCRAPAGRDGTGLRSRSHGTTAQALIAGLMERGRGMVPDGCRTSGARAAKCVLEVLRQLGAHVDVLPGDGVGEAEAPGMEELALETAVVRDAVNGIPADRQVYRLEVNPDLVRPPRLEPYVEQRMVAHRLLDLEPRARIARSRGVERVARAIAPIAADRRLDAARR